ncbi:hypothetical protein [Nocardia sp. NRRL S-836]|uniref:hypothetical protein n=1 Tax=Nocardia sp. NRRL S-836 TaxID=1519492 RepID=UPI000B227835|nr:hypothetical protein [Nocardia sp. NRRL S-836]
MVENAPDAALPELTGSPKQVAWATTLRADALAHLDEFRAGMAAHVATHPEAAVEQAANNAALDQVIAGHTAASWWIDMRHAKPEGIAYELRRDAQALLDNPREG